MTNSGAHQFITEDFLCSSGNTEFICIGRLSEVLSADPEVPNPGVRVGPNTPWLNANQIKIITEQPYLRVNEQGKRFINEEMSNQHTAMSRAYCNQTNMHGYMIFDEDTAAHLAESVEEDYVYFIFKGAKCEHIREQMDEAIAKGNRHMCHFDTIHKVCEYMGIDEDNLKDTIAKYNKAKEEEQLISESNTLKRQKKDLKIALKNAKRSRNRMKSSYSWRIGRSITWVPRKIKALGRSKKRQPKKASAKGIVLKKLSPVKVSVIIPVYNSERSINRLIKSLRQQQ